MTRDMAFPPQRATFGAQRVAVASGFMLCSLGLAVMFGWLTGSTALVQMTSGASAMRFNTAVLFTLCGVSLVLLGREQRRAVVGLGALIATMATATACQSLLGIDLRIDNLLLSDWSGVGPNPPGRMAINTAFCFVLTGVTLVSQGLRGAHRIQPCFEGILGSLVFAIGTASALGYVSGLEAAYGWGGSAGMALHTALGLAVCGGALIWMAVEHDKAWSPSPVWLPIPAAIMVLAISLVFWHALHQARRSQFQRLMDLHAETIENRISDRFLERLQSLKGMASRWTGDERPQQAHWEADASTCLEHFADWRSLKWIDSSGQIRWITDRQRVRQIPDSNDWLPSAAQLEGVRVRHQAVIYLMPEPGGAEPKAAILCPLFTDREFKGVLYAVLDVGKLISDVAGDVQKHGFAISVVAGSEQANCLTTTEAPAIDLIRERQVNCQGVPLRICLWPTSQALATRGSVLINATLAMGVLRAIFFALLIHFFQQSRRQLKITEEAGKALRASERRFRAIFDQTFQFIGLLSTDGTVLEANRSALAFSGILESDVVGKPFWETPWWVHCAAQQEKLRDAVKRAATGEVVRFEATHLDPQGNGIVVDFSLKPVLDERGAVQMLIPEGRDITAIKRAQSKANQVIEQAPNGILLVDYHGRIILANSHIDHLFGYQRSELIGQHAELLILWNNGDSECGEDSDYANEALGARSLVSGRRKDGSVFPLELGRSPILIEDGPAVLISLVDVSERVAAEEKLKASEQRYEWAVRGSSDGIWDWNLETQHAYYSPRYKQLLGYSEAEFADVIESFLSHLHPDDAAAATDAVNANLERGEPFNAVLRLRTKGREWRWFRVRGDAVRGAGGEAQRMAGSMADVTESVRAEQELTRDSRLDKLTGLPNRALFLDRLQQTILRAHRAEKHCYAVMFLDFDRFKIVNDSLGHDVGDALLKEIARRLQEHVRSVDSVSRRVTGNSTGRLGGDEFVVLLDEMQQPEEVQIVAERLMAAFAKPYQLGAHEVYSTASIGIVTGDARYERAEEVIRDADMAMYEAKRAGKARYVVFDASMRQRLQHRLQLESDLRKAIQLNQLSLVFQPIVSLSGGDLVMAEALLRWRHPAEGELKPADFIAIAEESELIHSLGDWTLSAGCRQMAEWIQILGPAAPAAISLNLSAKQFARRDFVRNLQRVLAESGIPPSRLQLELREDALVKDVTVAIETMKVIRGLGVRLAIHNFGTGIASFATLHRLPFDMLKVDRSLMVGLENSKDTASLIHALAVLVRNLGISLVAEGIETPAQVLALQELGCEFGQGYFFARPFDAAALADYVLKNTAFDHEASGANAFVNRWSNRMELDAIGVPTLGGA